MGGSRHREQRILAAVACPSCGAAAGVGCRLRSEAERATARDRLLVHGARRRAWQAWRTQRGVDVYVLAGQTLTARSPAAWATLTRLAPPDAIHDEPAVRVEPAQCGALVVALTQAGLRVE